MDKNIDILKTELHSAIDAYLEALVDTKLKKDLEPTMIDIIKKELFKNGKQPYDF